MHKILFVPSDVRNGVWFYRCVRPMEQMNKVCRGEWDITIDQTVKWDDFEYLSKFELVVIHNGVFNGDIQDQFWTFLLWAKKHNIKTVLDLDDYWDYGKDHPLYNHCIQHNIPFKVSGTIKLVDAVTTTTERFKDKISILNPNVYVIPNAICRDDLQFSTRKRVTKRVKVGFAGGSSHTNDIKELVNSKETFLDYMTNAQKDSMQVVLCGFDLEGYVNVVDENNNLVDRRKMEAEEVWWVKVEKMLTKDYTTVSKEYAELLKRYDRSDEAYDASDEPYKRVWTKKIYGVELDDRYGNIYKDIDILLVPLRENEFNSCKSELKFIEGGWTCTCVLASNVAPYSDWCHDGEDGMLVGKGAKNWARALKPLLRDTFKREQLAIHLRRRVLSERDLDTISKDRSAIYKKIILG